MSDDAVPSGPPLGPPGGPPAGPPQGPPPGPPISTAGGGSRNRSIIAVIAVIVVIALIAAAIALTNDDDDDKKASDTTRPGSGEVFLAPAKEAGPDPFTNSIATPTPDATVPLRDPVPISPGITAPPMTSANTTGTTPGSSPSLISYRGGVPGLYGGTRDSRSCDPEQMISFLQSNASKAAAWANAQGIGVSDIASFVRALTPVLLRGDTRVTNYGFRNGIATAHQSVLQAGTAVLVDRYGEPQAKCFCGNPLNPPVPTPVAPIYTGTPWSGFSPGNVTVVVKNTTVINVIIIIDVITGTPFGRLTGPDPGPDQPLPPISNQTTTTDGANTTTTIGGSTGVFTLVDATHTVGELVDSWTVDDRAGTAVISIPAGNGSYSWTVPQSLDPAGTRIEWGGTSTGNIHIDITVKGGTTDVVFDNNDRDVSSNTGDRKSAIVTVPTDVREVQLIYSMGFSVTATYTYRR